MRRETDMSEMKCPLCECPCIIRIIATEDDKWCQVDVCEMCGTMYPRGRTVVQVKPKKAKMKTKKTKPKKAKAKKKSKK